MNYIGSKVSLLPVIERAVTETGAPAGSVVCDAFAGTGAVGRSMRALGYRVLANDLQSYAFALNRAALEGRGQPAFERLRAGIEPELRTRRGLWEDPARDVLAYLNDLPGSAGFVSETYGPLGGRLYFTAENASRIDQIRQTIDAWRRAELISEYEEAYLLASLLEAADAVANVASVYDAFLKSFKPSALAPMRLRTVPVPVGPGDCRAYQQDAVEFVRSVEADVLYLDPPYVARCYARAYHVPETIARYDAPQVRGKTGVRPYTQSRFSSAASAEAALGELLAAARARHVIVSYSDEGLVSPERLRRLLGEFGETTVTEIEYERFRADSKRSYKRASTTEFVFHMRPAAELATV